jgi:hypothetical protein
MDLLQVRKILIAPSRLPIAAAGVKERAPGERGAAGASRGAQDPLQADHDARLQGAIYNAIFE